MTKIFSFFVSLFFAYGVVAAPMFGFESFSIQHKELGKIQFHVSAKNMNDSKPVLLYLDGSGSYPLFMYMQQGHGSTVPFPIDSLSNHYHFVVISKPGVPFADSVKMDTVMGFPIYPEPQEYTKRLSLDWRVNAALQVIASCKKQLKVKDGKFALIGISEGAQVAPKVAALSKDVKALITLGGNAVNQFYDFTCEKRLLAEKGEISYDEAEREIDSLYAVFADIFAHPTSTDKFWYGHTYLRWASFCNEDPLSHYMKVNVPIYVAEGSADKNSQVVNIDLLRHAFVRAGKSNLTMRIYPGMDHFFRRSEQEGQPPISHYDEVIHDALTWLARELQLSVKTNP